MTVEAMGVDSSVRASAEEAFLAWLLLLPDDIDIADAAISQLVRLEGRGNGNPVAERMRVLLAEAAGMGGKPC